MWIFVHIYSWGLTHFTINVKPISVVLYINFEHYWWFSIVFPFHSLFIFLFKGVRKYGIFIISTWGHFQGWWWRIACLGTGLLSWVLGSIRPGLANHRQMRTRTGKIEKCFPLLWSWTDSHMSTWTVYVCLTGALTMITWWFRQLPFIISSTAVWSAVLNFLIQFCF